MTAPDVILSVLRAIRNQWYADRVREYKRDEPALLKSIVRWGHECASRGWEFDGDAIRRDIMGILHQIQRANAPIQYLPVYLEGAITRSIGQRAEELQAAARSVERNVSKIVAGVKGVEAVRRVGVAEAMAEIYRATARRARGRRSKTKPEQAQLTLIP